MNELRFGALTPEQIRRIYYDDMVLQFPDQERRSFRNISSMVRGGMYAGYALFDGDTVCAYALAAIFPEKHAVLLDYLAAPAALHSRGYGSEMLRRLRLYFPESERILIETEDPDALEGERSRTAQRRLGFYSRNGYRQTSVRIHLFSVWYRLYINGPVPGGEVGLMNTMSEIYQTIVPPLLYKRNVHLEIAKEA